MATQVQESFEQFLEQIGRYSADVFKNPATKQLLADAKADDFLIFLGGYDQSLQRINDAYRERNTLVAFISKLFPSGYAKTAIEGWDEDWHHCCYIDFPWGQASWHFHTEDADLFTHLQPYTKEYDGHTTAAKYEAIKGFTVL